MTSTGGTSWIRKDSRQNAMVALEFLEGMMTEALIVVLSYFPRVPNARQDKPRLRSGGGARLDQRRPWRVRTIARLAQVHVALATWSLRLAQTDDAGRIRHGDQGEPL